MIGIMFISCFGPIRNRNSANLLMRIKAEKNHPDAVNEIRGLGLIDGIQLNKPSGQPVVDLCFKDSNVLINNTNGNVLRFVPPLIVNEEEIDIVIKAVDEAMTKLGW